MKKKQKDIFLRSEGNAWSFISSTFWTDRIGPTAALATLNSMEEMGSWESITNTGLDIRAGWNGLAEKYALKIKHWGLPALTGFTIQSPNAAAYKTLISQEMLTKGYLASNSVYVCTEHTPSIVADYFCGLESVFALISECEGGRDVKKLLRGPVCHNSFERLN